MNEREFQGLSRPSKRTLEIQGFSRRVRTLATRQNICEVEQLKFKSQENRTVCEVPTNDVPAILHI